jgi:SAM-dependent methyltransferase
MDLTAMKFEDYVRANRDAWDEAAPRHRAHASFAELLEHFGRPGYSCLDASETKILQAIGVRDKAVAQLCCNNGRELLSVLNMGARRGVGFDISAEFLALAAELRERASSPCEFVQGSVFDIGHEHDGAFELVTLTIGALGWMPDLERFFAVVARLLTPEGQVFVYEQHPLCDVFEPNDSEPLKIRHSYFRTEPYLSTDGLDYLGNQPYAARPCYWFHHKMSDVIGGALKNGLTLELFEEYPHDVASAWSDLERSATPPPLSYALVARKA